MRAGSADILMITYRTPQYVRISLPALLASCREDDRVWLWHNGDDEETLSVVESHADDPRVARFHHSRENVRLHQPTTWLWTGSDAEFVSKVDDDCVVDPAWIATFAQAHGANPAFGAVGSWRHPDEDLLPELPAGKVVAFAGGHRLMRNLWVQGSGYLLHRRWIDRYGPLGNGETFTRFCIRIARHGAVNGWYYPFVREDHMDDPRSARTLLRTDEDLLARLPLSAQYNGVRTLADWERQIRQSAVTAQSASLDLRQYTGWRTWLRSADRRARRLAGLRVSW